jgi:hypothetical protein
MSGATLELRVVLFAESESNEVILGVWIRAELLSDAWQAVLQSNEHFNGFVL